MPILALADFAVPLVVGVACLAWAAGWLRSPRYTLLVGMAGLLFFAVRVTPLCIIKMPEGHFDFTSFWDAGQDVIKGLDPIVENSTRPLPTLNLPTASPLFELFGRLPYRQSFACWTVANALFTIVLGLVCWSLVSSLSPGRELAGLPLFLATLCLSNASRSCMTSGQLGILTACALLVALKAQQVGRWVTSAAALAVASIKIGTLVPMMFLFTGRNQWRVWLAAAALCFALALRTESPQSMPERARQWLATIERLSQPGAVNDFALPQNDDMISLDHAFYRALGHDRGRAKLLQAVTLGLIGLGLGLELFWIRRLTASSQQALVCLYASLFLYHRLTDMAILALPFCVTLMEARRTCRVRRLVWLSAGVLLLLVLFLQRRGLVAVRQFVEGHPGVGSRLLEAIVLPHACWAILLAMLLIGWNGRRVESTPA